MQLFQSFLDQHQLRDKFEVLDFASLVACITSRHTFAISSGLSRGAAQPARRAALGPPRHAHVLIEHDHRAALRVAAAREHAHCLACQRCVLNPGRLVAAGGRSRQLHCPVEAAPAEGAPHARRLRHHVCFMLRFRAAALTVRFRLRRAGGTTLRTRSSFEHGSLGWWGLPSAGSLVLNASVFPLQAREELDDAARPAGQLGGQPRGRKRNRGERAAAAGGQEDEDAESENSDNSYDGDGDAAMPAAAGAGELVMLGCMLASCGCIQVQGLAQAPEREPARSGAGAGADAAPLPLGPPQGGRGRGRGAGRARGRGGIRRARGRAAKRGRVQ